MAITNGDLLQAKKTRWRNKLFMVTREPVYLQDKNIYEIVINEKDPAAVLDSLHDSYPEQPTIGNIINQGSTKKVRWNEDWEDLWLLSAGNLIFNETGQIALGQQGDKADNPNLWTSIGVGLCDQELKSHCFEELESKFIMFVFVEEFKGHDQELVWKRVCFRTREELERLEPKPEGPQKLYTLEEKPFDEFIKQELDSIHRLNKPIFQEYIHLEPLMKPFKDEKLATLRKNVEIILKGPSGWEWDITRKGPYEGYIWEDEDNHTIEFRLHQQFNLTDFTNYEIFFGEGTGNAMWKSLQEIDELIEGNFNKGRVRLLTPFMSNLLKEYKEAEEFNDLLMAKIDNAATEKSC